MWVVKLGGSLGNDATLPKWLALLAQLGGGRVVVVCGGGRYADEVRRAQAHWQFDDLAAHNMAVLAMAQSAYLCQSLEPQLQLASSKADIRRVIQKGRAVVWLPFEAMRQQPAADTNWDNTSDSIALDLARKLNAERLVVVKSCAIDPNCSLAQLSEIGVVDRRFGSLAQSVAFPIDVMQRDELDRMRALLLGEPRLLDV